MRRSPKSTKGQFGNASTFYESYYCGFNTFCYLTRLGVIFSQKRTEAAKRIRSCGERVEKREDFVSKVIFFKPHVS